MVILNFRVFPQLFFAYFLIFPLVCIFLPPALAQGEEFYTVPGVAVDVTGESAAAARDQAILQGQRKAFDLLLGRMVQPQDRVRLPALPDARIADLVQDFEVESEKLSSVRYLGRLGFRFKAEPVRALLMQAGVQFADLVAEPLLILPVLVGASGPTLWGNDNPWRQAWRDRPAVEAAVPLIVPVGDNRDQQIIDAGRAVGGDLPALNRLATAYGAGAVLVAELHHSLSSHFSTTLKLTRYDFAGAGGKQARNVEVTAREADLYSQAMQTVVNAIEWEWRYLTSMSDGSEQRLPVTIPIQSLAEWQEVRRRLGSIPFVRRGEVISLSKGAGKLNLVYLGDMARLQQALLGQGLLLSQSPAGEVTLRLQGGPASPPASPTLHSTQAPLIVPPQ